MTSIPVRRRSRRGPIARAAAAASILLAIAGPVNAQQASADQKPAPASVDRPAPAIAFEAGVVMGIIAQPYATAGVQTGRWSFRISGIAGTGSGRGVQFNGSRVLRDRDNTKHTIGVMWARFAGARSFRPSRGEYYGVMYGFHAKAFFIEAGPGFGADNPVRLGPRHVYGQMGFIYRFGKRYVGDE